VWGLLGAWCWARAWRAGASARRDHILAFLLAMPAFYIGWRLINLPQVITSPTP
jgi:hypothetical protein